MLSYPYDSEIIFAKRKQIRRHFLSDGQVRIEKRIAVLGGSTTHDIAGILELFLLHHGILPKFYESEFGQYWQDAMFPNSALKEFSPDIIFIHTSNRNIMQYPQMLDDAAALEKAESSRFSQMWDKLSAEYACPIIQNNFEYPFYRLLGNKDATDVHGRTNFIAHLNLDFAEYASSHENFFINDINWQSADYGLREWSDPFYWHMYKYALALPAVPYLAHNVANIIKSIFGKNKKAFVLDLDNTLWGGVIGDDGAENIAIGQEASAGQVFSEFQSYIKSHKQIGVILNVASKNEEENAIAGLNHPDSILTPDDFISIKANWEPKSANIAIMAKQLALNPDSFVFVDDNPAEREIVRQQLPGISVPEISIPEHYILEIDRAGYFETTVLTGDDAKRNAQYKENAERAILLETFADYEEYLLSLEMTADIRPFESMYMSRIAQLTNKSNQFNLTTKRYTQPEIEAAAADANRITLYGKLTDKFGDNGVVTVAIGRIEETTLHMELWLMSCRVLKRGMEDALLDELVGAAKARGLTEIRGYYYPTNKNGMVRDFYGRMGFAKINEGEDGSSTWALVTGGYARRCHAITVNGKGGQE
jgi:FkbH-like protein